MKQWLLLSLLIAAFTTYTDDSDSSDSELEDFQPGQTRRLLQAGKPRTVIDQKRYDQNMRVAVLLAQEMCLGQKFIKNVQRELDQRTMLRN